MNRVGKGTAVLMNRRAVVQCMRRRPGGRRHVGVSKPIEAAVGRRWVSLQADAAKVHGSEITYWKKGGRTILFVCMNPEISVSSTGGGNSVGLKTETVPVTLGFAGKLAGVRDERMGKDLGDGTEFKFDWKMNEALVLSFDGAPPQKR